MKKFLIDTSIIIDFLRKKDKERSILYKLAKEQLFISIITHTELYGGRSIWEKKAAKDALEKVLQGISLLPLDQNISIKSGYLKAKYHNTSLFDCIIAATALTHGIIFVTLNRKDFERIDGIRLLDLEEL